MSMRARSFVILLVASLLSLPAGVLASPAADAPTGTPDSWRPAPSLGSPLRLAHPSVWLPVLFETHSLAAAATAARQPPPMPPPRFGPPSTAYDVFRLGDADKDGKGDLLLEERTTTPDYLTTSRLSAISGATWKTLWSLEVAMDSYWYPTGDGTGDGVLDLVVSKTRFLETPLVDQTNNGASVQATLIEVSEDLQVIDGAKGTSRFTASMKDWFATGSVYGHAYSSGVVSATQGVETWSWHISFLEALPPAKTFGFDFVSGRFEMRSTWTDGYAAAAPAFAMAHTGVSVERVEIRRTDADGRTVWTRSVEQPGRSSYPVDNGDLNADGSPDWAIAYGGADHASAGVFSSAVQEFVHMEGNPLLSTQIELVDGKSGAISTIYQSDPYVGFAQVTPAGVGKDGVGRLLVSQVRMPQADPQGAECQLSLVDARGRELGTHLCGALAISGGEFGDADHDGESELLLRAHELNGSFVEGLSWGRSAWLSLVGSDFKPRWTLEGEAIHFWWGHGSFVPPDFNGDQVPDLLFSERGEDDGALVVRSGATGEELWSLRGVDGLIRSEAIESVDGTAGAELALVMREVDASKPGPLGLEPSSDVPRTEEPPEEFAPPLRPAHDDAPVFLEIRRGTDAQLVWKKELFDPTEFPEDQRPSGFSTEILTVDDLNANGFRDIAVSVGGESMFMIMEVMAEGQDSAQHSMRCCGGSSGVSFALALEGADGSTLHSFPAQYAGKAAERGPASPFGMDAVPDPNEVPSPGLLVASLAVAASLVLWRRRQA